MISRLPHQSLVIGGMILCTCLAGANTRAAELDSANVSQQAQAAFDTGKFSEAAVDWQRAGELFRTQHNTNAAIRTSISLAGAYEALGQYRSAVQLLEEAQGRAERAKDASLITLAKWKLGAALVMTQEPERADGLLNEALTDAKANHDELLSAAILNDLGNSLAAQQKFSDALKVYRESADLSRHGGNTPASAQALCNAALMAARAGDNDSADGLNIEALKATHDLAASHGKAFLLLTAGQTDRQIKFPDAEAAKRVMLRANSSFQEALQIAEQQGDHATETYALGYLGQIYEQDGQVESALSLTRRAAFAAQQAQMPEARYRWE